MHAEISSGRTFCHVNGAFIGASHNHRGLVEPNSERLVEDHKISQRHYLTARYSVFPYPWRLCR
jgi:hypothetical protein